MTNASMRRVRFTAPMVQDGGVTWYAGDIKRMPIADADRILAAGWGEDADTGDRPNRQPGTITIEPHSIITTLGA